MSSLLAIATGVLFGLGVFQLLRRDLVKSAMGFFILFGAINLLLLAVGAFEGTTAPYVDDGNRTAGQAGDPLVQALILTAIIISFGSYALLLGLISVASRRFDTLDGDELDALQK